jgi:hypothetical protein
MRAWVIAFGAVLIFGGLGWASLLWIAAYRKEQGAPLTDAEETAALTGELIGCVLGVVGIGLITWASNYL